MSKKQSKTKAPKLSNDKKQKVDEFMNVTGCSSANTSASFLERFNWDLNISVDEYFMDPPAPEEPDVDENKILTLFF